MDSPANGTIEQRDVAATLPLRERESVSRVSIVIERVIFYALMVLIVVVATPYGIVSPWRGIVEAVFECGVFALGLLWMLEGMLSGSWVTRRHLLMLPLIALAAFAYFQTVAWGNSAPPAGITTPVWQAVSFDPYETRLMVLKLLAYALTLGLLLRYTSSPGRFRVLVFVLVGLVVASALFAILRQTTQRGALEFLFPYVRLDRGYGQFVNRNHFAFLMEMGLGLLLGLIAVARRERVLIYLAAALPVWSALVLSNSRGGILSMLCQLLFLMLLFGAVRRAAGGEARDHGVSRKLARLGRSMVVRASLGALLLAAILVGVVWVGGEQLVSRFEAVPGEVAAEAQGARVGGRRTEIWGATWRMIKEHPLAGVGLGGYWAAVPQYHNASGRATPQQAHNDYLELLASGGLLGLLLGGWFLYLLVKLARQRLQSKDAFRRAACFGALAGLFGIAIHSLVDFGLHIPANAVVALGLVGVCTVNGRVEKRERRRAEQSANVRYASTGVKKLTVRRAKKD